MPLFVPILGDVISGKTLKMTHKTTRNLKRLTRWLPICYVTWAKYLERCRQQTAQKKTSQDQGQPVRPGRSAIWQSSCKCSCLKCIRTNIPTQSYHIFVPYRCRADAEKKEDEKKKSRPKKAPKVKVEKKTSKKLPFGDESPERDEAQGTHEDVVEEHEGKIILHRLHIRTYSCIYS